MAGWMSEGAVAEGRAIAEGRLDPRDAVEGYLEAIATHPDGARVYARTCPERARAEAAAAARRRDEGRRLGPLDGVCLSWKDNIDSAGLATEAGSRLLAGRVPREDAAVLDRASAAGLVCLGKTHLSELAFSGLGINPMTATAPNARLPGRAPGGSSAGAAASVALSLAAGAVGTDTGGSVRIPAAWQGLVGLKTTPGRLPNDGVVPLAPSLDTVGPLARSVADAWAIFAALDGAPTAERPDAALPPRLLAPEAVVAEGCDDAVAEAHAAALGRLSAAGVALERGPVPEIALTFEAAARLSPLVTVEAWETWGAAIDAAPGALAPMIEARFRLGAGAERGAVATARAEFARLGDALAARMAAEGPVVMPSVACLPPETARLAADEAFYVERNLLALRNTRLANLLGLPAITLPLPETACAIMLLGRPDGEAALVAAAGAIEARLGA